MGFPLRSWGDIIDRREEFEERLKPAFFCFVLYKSSHVNFREFILRNFNRLHEDSRDVIFFVLDTPEDWLKREDIEYYRSMYGDHYNPELNDQEVDLVCDYFSIHPNKLPAIVAFPNLRSRSCNVFSLKNIETNHELLSIFETLFQHGRNVEYGYSSKYPNNLLYNRSNVIRRRFPTISTQISYFEDSRNVIDKFEQLNETITQMRSEMREGFNTIISKLENIQDQIKPFKLALASESSMSSLKTQGRKKLQI